MRVMKGGRRDNGGRVEERERIDGGRREGGREGENIHGKEGF